MNFKTKVAAVGQKLSDKEKSMILFQVRLIRAKEVWPSLSSNELKTKLLDMKTRYNKQFIAFDHGQRKECEEGEKQRLYRSLWKLGQLADLLEEELITVTSSDCSDTVSKKSENCEERKLKECHVKLKRLSSEDIAKSAKCTLPIYNPRVENALEYFYSLLKEIAKDFVPVPRYGNEEVDCECILSAEDKAAPGHFYGQLGFATDPQYLQEEFVRLYNLNDSKKIKLIQVSQQKTSSETGCESRPEDIIEREGEEEVSILWKHRQGHQCIRSAQVVLIIDWLGIHSEAADNLYTRLSGLIKQEGIYTAFISFWYM